MKHYWVIMIPHICWLYLLPMKSAHLLSIHILMLSTGIQRNSPFCTIHLEVHSARLSCSFMPCLWGKRQRWSNLKNYSLTSLWNWWLWLKLPLSHSSVELHFYKMIPFSSISLVTTWASIPTHCENICIEEPCSVSDIVNIWKFNANAVEISCKVKSQILVGRV